MCVAFFLKDKRLKASPKPLRKRGRKNRYSEIFILTFRIKCLESSFFCSLLSRRRVGDEAFFSDFCGLQN